LLVPTVAVVVFAHCHTTPEVWLNVVAFVALESVSAPVAFPMLFHTTVPEGMSAATIARKVGANAPPDAGPARNVLAVCVASAKVPEAPMVAVKTVPSPTFTATPLLVGRVSVGVAELAGAVIVYFPEAVLLAKAIVPVDVPGIPSTGAVVYAGAAEVVPLFPNTVPPAALVKLKVRAGVVVDVATDVVKSGLRFPALKEVTVPPEEEGVTQAAAVPELAVSTWPAVGGVALSDTLGYRISAKM